jgi:hypothetical protein
MINLLVSVGPLPNLIEKGTVSGEIPEIYAAKSVGCEADGRRLQAVAPGGRRADRRVDGGRKWSAAPPAVFDNPAEQGVFLVLRKE